MAMRGTMTGAPVSRRGRVPSRALLLALIVSCFVSLPGRCGAQGGQQQGFEGYDAYVAPPPQQQQPPPPAVESDAGMATDVADAAPEEKPDNLFENLWNIASGTLTNIAKSTNSEGGEPSDVSQAVDLFLDTTGSVGNTVADFDSTKTRNKNTGDGFLGFFNNLGGASGKTIGRTVEAAAMDVTSNEWFQGQVVDGVSGLFGAAPADTGAGDAAAAPANPPSASGYPTIEGGMCELEWNSNYQGELLNNGHETILMSEGECCQLCDSIEECNTWVFCGDPNGCGAPYYAPGECYLKHQKYPQNRKAYERGQGVHWTSGIKAYAQGDQSFTMKSFTSPQEAIDRDIIHVSGKPKTWYFDDIPLVSPGLDPSRNGVMRAKVEQCGNYNLLPGVASYNKDFNMRLATPGATPGGPVLLLWSNSAGNSLLPGGFMGSPCGPLDLQLYFPQYSGTGWDQQIARADDSGTATFFPEHVNLSNGNKCTTYLYQYVDIATCKVSRVLDTRQGL